MRKFTVTVNGQDYDVVVKDSGAAAAPVGGAGNRTAGDREGPQLCQSPDWRGPERSL